MPTLKRMAVTAKAVSSGIGSGTAADVAIGPDFGEGAGNDGKTFSVSVAAPTMPSIALETTFPVATSLDGDLAIAFATPIPVTATAALADLALEGTVSATAAITMPDVALAATLPVTATLTGTDAVTQYFRSSGTTTWTCPTGVSSATVQCWGGGGVGGAPVGINQGGGGRGGSYARSTVSVTAGSNYDVVVGAGGTVATPNGGQTIFKPSGGADLVRAAGGNGTATQTGATTDNGTNLGTTTFAGASGTNGTTLAGGNGGGGAGAAGNASGTTGGTGDGTEFSTGGTGGAQNVDGTQPGGAGGGQGILGTRGLGAAGQVKVTWTVTL